MGKIPAGTHPNMAEEVIITDANGEHLELTEDGKLPVEMTVNIEATIEESQMHGSTDGGTTWVPIKVGADGSLEVQLKGSKTRVSSPPVTGVKTVTGVAAEIFAGTSRKAGRSRLVLRNMHSSLRFRVGSPTVTDTTGFGVEPQAVVEIDIDPASDVPWYAVSEAGAISVEVFEA